MPTLFESMFPLLSLKACISPRKESLNGPLFSAVDRTTGEWFEVQTVTVASASSSAALTYKQCKSRAADLLAASSIGNAFVLLPEDVYVADETHAPVSSPIAMSSSSVADMQLVCVTRMAGPSLADILSNASKKGSRESRPQQSSHQAKMSVVISEASFRKILCAVSTYCSLHLTLPVHGNISLHAIRARQVGSASSLDDAAWVISDWALDPNVVAAEVAKSQTPSEATRRFQQRWLKVLKEAFLGYSVPDPRLGPRTTSFTVGLTTTSPRRRSVRGSPLRQSGSVAPLFVVTLPSGSLLPAEDIELSIVRSVCSVAAGLGGLRQPDCQRQASVESNDSYCSLEERAKEHVVELAHDRLTMMEQAAKHKVDRAWVDPIAISAASGVPEQKQHDVSYFKLELPAKKLSRPHSGNADFIIEPPRAVELLPTGPNANGRAQPNIFSSESDLNHVAVTPATVTVRDASSVRRDTTTAPTLDATIIELPRQKATSSSRCCTIM